MKKIVSAALLTAMVAGAASAEVALKLDTKFTADIYKQETKVVTVDSKKSEESMSLIGGNFANSGVVQFTAKGDTTEISAKVKLTGGSNTVGIDSTYYGKIKFDGLNFTVGQYDSRASLAYNKKTTELGLTDGTAGKYGPKSVAFAFDNNNSGAINKVRVLSFIADYTFADVAGGKLLLKAGANQDAAYFHDSADGYVTTVAKDAQNKDDASKYKPAVAEVVTPETRKQVHYIANAFYQLPDVVNVELAARAYTYKNTAYSLIAAPAAVPGLAAGFTYVMSEDDAYAFSVDAGYAGNPISDVPLQVIAQVKYESAKAKDVDAETALYAALGLGYQINDTVKVALDATVDMVDLDDNDKADGAKNSFTIQPAVQFKSGAGTIQTGFKFTKVLDDDVAAPAAGKSATTIQTIQVPVTVKIAL